MIRDSLWIYYSEHYSPLYFGIDIFDFSDSDEIQYPCVTLKSAVEAQITRLYKQWDMPWIVLW